MAWLTAWPEFAAALAIVLGPGLLVVVALRARGIIAIGLAPAVSVAVVAVAAIGSTLVGLPLSMWSLAAVTALAAVVALVVGLFVRRPERRDDSRHRRRLAGGFAAGLALAVVTLAWRTMDSLISPAHVSQRFDIVFHLNGVRRILDTGDGSSLTMGTLNGDSGILSFYPAAWHDIVALVIELAHTHRAIDAIPYGAAAVDVVVAAVVWPLGCLALVRAAAGSRALPLVWTGVFCAAFGAFPLRLLEWGVVLPFFLAVALLPAAVAAVVVATGVARRPGIGRGHALALGAVALVGIALSQTSGVVALIALTIPVVVTALVRGVRGGSRRASWVWLAVYSVFVAGVWWAGRPRNGFPGWETPFSFPVAVAAFFGGIPLGGPLPFLALAAVAAASVWILVRRRERAWLVGMLVVAGFLYIAVAGVPRSVLRSILAGPWYEDFHRIAALTVIPMVVLAAFGADLVVRRAVLALRRRRVPRWIPIAATAGVVVLAVPIAQYPLYRDAGITRQSYVLDASSQLLSSNEHRLLWTLDALVPADAVIADNPWDGSALAYALADRRVMFAHLLHQRTPDQELISQRLRDATTDPAVCAALERENVRYVLDFGPVIDGNPLSQTYPGFEDLESSDAVEEVARDGDAVLYRITACGRG